MRLAAFLILTLLAAGPVVAQPSPARNTTATGATKPPGNTERVANAPFSKPGTEAAMIKAQKASAARDKAWDAKMRTTMGSICQGC
ncbi:MAG: hypothetical protein K2Y56_22665 [Methylobacterium sp.]|uniref:hypothetical protein n=1 Tax=Methylobacterium sp. TaxID=409 RepID=UPI0025CF1C45|nr:hypothetical protein [Methylobacterium sp.]MBX9934283.1 hypothetical protein [Methylobacterium sp.]